MKKILLSLAAFVSVLSASAESKEWTASFEPVSDAKELKGIHTTTAADGSVYVSSTYNQDFTFAGKVYENPKEWTSANIVKYSATGEELWAVTMEGAAVVYALDTDTDGTLYAAGNFLGGVTYTGTDGVSAQITSTDVYSAFVAKISADGKFETVKVITPANNEEIAASELPFYFPLEAIYIAPNKIQVEGDKVYVSAKYMGDVARLGWKGAYILSLEMGMYLDNYSMGVFSLNKTDLTSEKNVAYIQSTGTISEFQNYPEAISFVADNGTVYVGFIGYQNLSLTTPNDTTDFTFTTEGSMEHALVVAAIGETTTTKTFNVAPHDKSYVPYNLFMEAADENLIIGGTYYGELYFDTEKSTDELSYATFMASVKAADNTVNWAYTGEVETEATCMNIAETAMIAAADSSYTTVDLTTGTANTVAMEQAFLSADATTTVYTNDTKVFVCGKSTESSDIEEVITEQKSSIRYNLAGQAVDNNYKGFVIMNGKKYLMK